jgi:hypothetical protein
MQIPKISLIIFCIFVTLICILLLLHPNSQVLAQQQFLTYEDSELGISIQYPSNWEKIASLDNFVTFTAPPETDTRIYPAALGLKVQELPSQNIPLQEITKVQMSDLKRSTQGLKVLESKSTTLVVNLLIK